MPDGGNTVFSSTNEFVELYNPTSGAVDLGGWRFKGDSEYTFPTGTTLGAGEYSLVVNFDPADTTTLAAFRTQYDLPAATTVLGPYSDRLENNTHDIEVAYPATISGSTAYVLVDKVGYRDISPWPTSPDGTGKSLQRISSSLIGHTAANWLGDNPTPGAVNAGVVVGLAVTTPSPLAGGVVGNAYSTTLAAAGGTTPYSWTMTPSSVSGLTLSSTGVLSGTPMTAGAFTFSAQVVDNQAETATKNPEITIASAALVIATDAALPEGTVAVAYSQTLAASGGTPPYTWSVSDGWLPGGLTLNGAGVISGTPTNSGTYNFTVTVVDSGGLKATKTFSLFIPVPPLTITSASPMFGAELDTPYSQALTAVGGVTPYRWSVAGGSLPAGVSLTSAGAISGTLSEAATNSFTVRVTDSINATAPCVYTVIVSASGPLDHFTWDSVPTPAPAHQPFTVRLAARDAAERIVTRFNGAVDVSAAIGSGSFTSPIFITEITDEGEDQFELQNVTAAAVDAIGWFVMLGDSQTDINTLNSITYSLSGTLAAGGLLRVNREAVTPSGQWSGAPVVPGTRGTLGNTFDSWQRIGTNDSNTASDWFWRHNTDSTDATSFNLTNSGLTIPWSTLTPVTMTPSSLTLTSGECIGSLTISQIVSGVRLTADNGEHTGVSAVFDVVAEVDTDTDNDGMLDAWETVHGLSVGVNDASLDPDHDGQNNLDEYLAGTDPKSAASQFVIASVGVDAAGQLTITWPGVADKLYHVWYSPDLTTWTSLDTLFLPTASGLQTATLDMASAKTLFVRVQVGPAP